MRRFLAPFLVLPIVLGCAAPAFAQALDPDLVPPEVVIPTSSPTTPTPTVSTTSTTPAPGLNQPGQAPAPPSGGPPPPPAGHSARGMPGDIPPHRPIAPVSPQAQVQIDPNKPDPLAIIETPRGLITIRLFQQLAPKTVTAFMDMVSKGFYNGLTFHRVENFCIQGGCPHGTGGGFYKDPQTQKPRFLQLEVSGNLSHNAPGVVAMARAPKNPNSASCQFYITLLPQQRLDHQYTIFGGVISGMDVVRKIQKGDQINSISLRAP